MHAVDIITLSREYGAGASDLAEALGAHLGWPVLDHQIPALVAERLEIPDEALEDSVEHVPTLLENIGTALLRGTPELLIDPNVVGVPEPSVIAAATRELIHEAAAHPPLIVVGHGGQSLFHGRAGTLHVRLVAPVESRIRRICGRRPCSANDAMALARRVDSDRAHYIRQHYGRDVRDPTLYHLVINTSAVAMSEALRLVLDLVHHRAAS